MDARAAAAAPLIATRAEAIAQLNPPFATAASELGLEGGAALEYAPRAVGTEEEVRAGLEQRREQDLRMGRSSWGPHLDELKVNGLAGTPDEVVEKIGRFAEIGAERIYLQVLDLSDLDHLELIADRVAPQVA